MLRKFSNTDRTRILPPKCIMLFLFHSLFPLWSPDVCVMETCWATALAEGISSQTLVLYCRGFPFFYLPFLMCSGLCFLWPGLIEKSDKKLARSGVVFIRGKKKKDGHQQGSWGTNGTPKGDEMAQPWIPLKGIPKETIGRKSLVIT